MKNRERRTGEYNDTEMSTNGKGVNGLPEKWGGGGLDAKRVGGLGCSHSSN